MEERKAFVSQYSHNENTLPRDLSERKYNYTVGIKCPERRQIYDLAADCGKCVQNIFCELHPITVVLK